MRVYLSTGAFRCQSLGEIVEFSLEHGIDHIELSSGVSYRPNLLEPVRATNGTIHYLVHNYFPPPEDPFVLNLAASDTQILRRSRDLCQIAIDLTAKLGAPFYSVHSGFAFQLSPNLLGDPSAQAHLPNSRYVSYDVAYSIFVESVTILTEYARSKGVRLLIENNVVSPLYLAKHGNNALLMASADEIIRLIQDVNDPNLGVLVDVGHLKVTATALGFQREQFVEIVAPYIGAFHLSDNDGYTDQNLPFDETTWFCPLLRESCEVPIVIEAYELSWQQMQRQYEVLYAVLG